MLVFVFLAVVTAQPAHAFSGQLDVSYSGNGSFVLDPDGAINAIGRPNLDNHDRLLILGATRHPEPVGDHVTADVWRVNTAGRLDDSFSNDGHRVIDLSPDCDTAAAAEVQRDDKIIVVGTACHRFSRSAIFTNAIAYRLKNNGSRDRSFGGRDALFRWRWNFEGPDFSAVDVQIRFGKIYMFATDHEYLYVVRVSKRGYLDRSYADQGVAAVSLTESDSAKGGLVQRNGKVVITGFIGGQAGLVRLTADGKLDREFGDGGWVVLDALGEPSEYIHDVARRDGQYVATGLYDYGSVIYRLNSDGSLDQTFAEKGVVLPPDRAATGVVSPPLLRPSGKFFIVSSAVAPDERLHLAAAKFTGRGNLDSSWGADGVAYGRISEPSWWEETRYGVLRQSNGKILAVGRANRGFAASRFLSD